jgi:Zn-dependent peptidase ImmA (M78 family)
MARESLSIPDRSYDELRIVAEHFLAEHHTGRTIPVPVEEIIEFRLGLNIIPMPGLRRFFDIDGYVSKSLRDISVDLYIQESRSDYYRYVLAHELSHILIHGGIISRFDFDSIEAWKAAIIGIAKEERAVYDGQAHELGTLILVPTDQLTAEFERDRKRFEQRGLTLNQVVATERGRIIVEDDLARRFDVPRFAITDRTNRAGLWLR